MVGTYCVGPKAELNVVSSTGPPAATALRAVPPPPVLVPVTVTEAEPVHVALGTAAAASVRPLIVIVLVPAVRPSEDRGVIVMMAGWMPLTKSAVLGSGVR